MITRLRYLVPGIVKCIDIFQVEKLTLHLHQNSTFRIFFFFETWYCSKMLKQLNPCNFMVDNDRNLSQTPKLVYL